MEDEYNFHRNSMLVRQNVCNWAFAAFPLFGPEDASANGRYWEPLAQSRTTENGRLADVADRQLAGAQVTTPCSASIKTAVLCNEVASDPTY